MINVTHKLLGKKSFWLTAVLLLSVSSFILASKGGDDKSKKGYVLKFNGFEVKSTYLTPLSLIQQGATYKGNVSPMQTPNGNAENQHSIITYQKGNTIFIYPLQQKGLIHRLKTPSRDNR
jgi:hypothetical protein